MTDQWLGAGSYYNEKPGANPEDLIAIYEGLLKEKTFVIVTYYRGVW
jgi:hypothetical protein